MTTTNTAAASAVAALAATLAAAPVVVPTPAKTAPKTTARKVANKAVAKATKAAAPAGKGKAAPVAAVALYGIHDGYRPSAGRMLRAFTEAWIVATGLGAGGSIPRNQLRQIAGATAISYHMGNGNFVERGGRVELSEKGMVFFGSRITDDDIARKYITALKTGKVDPSININRADVFRKVVA